MNAKRTLHEIYAASATLLLASSTLGQDYPGATWNPADGNNYAVAARTTSEIRWIVIHTTEDADGSDCSVSQNWFKNPNQNSGHPGVSAHYVICRDGTIVQMVRDKDVAYHAGNLTYNNQSIGIEHERHDTSNWTEAQFQSSAQLVRWLVSHYSIQGVFPDGIAPAAPSNGSGIIGHNQVPDPNNPAVGGGMNHRSDPVNWDWAHYRAVFGASNFVVTAERALRVAVPTRESYQYQVFSSSDMSNWVSASDLVTACATNEIFSFQATNNNAFYRAQELPPDLSKRIPGLTNVFLDTARVTSRGNQVTLAGMRVQSRDYTYNDFLIATYSLDVCKQSLQVQKLEVITNVGATCGIDPTFFLKDATNALVLLGPTGNPYLENTTYTRTFTGQVATVQMIVGQMLDLVLSGDSEFRVVVTDPAGIQISDHVVPAGSGSSFSSPYNAFKPGQYSVRFIPFGSTSVNVTYRFRNINRRPTTSLVSGGTLSASLEDYWADFAKFRIRANSGHTLRLANTPGAGQTVTVCDSLGIAVAGFTGGGTGTPLVVPINKTDDYTIIYFHRDFTSHSYSTPVTLTP